MIAGTAIGAGMIALPMTLAKLGTIATLGLISVTWMIVYYSALLGTELTIRRGESLTLSEIARRISGRGAEMIAIGCIMTLSYALLAAYLYGGSSITHTLFKVTVEQEVPLPLILKMAAALLCLFLTLGIKWIDYINRLLFFTLIGLLIGTIGGLGVDLEIKTLPSMTTTLVEMKTWTVAIPVIFTSFGFQMMIPAISGYLNRDAIQIRRAFFWGSLIPVVVYLTWTMTTLGTLTTKAPALFDEIIATNVEVGDFVQMVSKAASWSHLQLLVWGVSFFAIVTSALGVALGLVDIWQKLLPGSTYRCWQRLGAALITVAPPFAIALLTPGAFIKALGFAGMILVIIAIILPTYLIFKDRTCVEATCYRICQSPFIRWLGATFALGLIICELYNMLG